MTRLTKVTGGGRQRKGPGDKSLKCNVDMLLLLVGGSHAPTAAPGGVVGGAKR